MPTDDETVIKQDTLLFKLMMHNYVLTECFQLKNSKLKSGLKYSIVVSHTKIFIVKNTNEVLTDDDSLIKNIVKFNDDFYGKIDRLTEEKLSMYDDRGLDFWETEKLRKSIRNKLLEEHVQEYEEGMSKFFEEGTGLTLYVHDK